LDLHQRPDDLARLPLARDVEVLQRALRLRPPEMIGGDLDGAEGVVFDAGGHACTVASLTRSVGARIATAGPCCENRRQANGGRSRMSLLTSALRTVFDVAVGKRPPELPATLGAVEDPAERLEVPATNTPAWKLLAGETGMQDLSYGEDPRSSVQRFGHVPRRLLDVGCATGAVGAGVKRAIPGVWVWDCEPNERAARIAATRLDHVTAAPRERWGDA